MKNRIDYTMQSGRRRGGLERNRCYLSCSGEDAEFGNIRLSDVDPDSQ